MKRLHLDTNALIALADPSHPLFSAIEQELGDGGIAATDCIAWHEFVRGPLLPEDRHRALLVVENRVIELDRRMAELAADLFNTAGRRRSSTADCLIAAVCILTDAELVTRNIADFISFVPLGLRILGTDP